MIKDLVRNIIPYGIIQKRIHTANRKKKAIFSTNSYGTIPFCENKFKTIISVQGFGYSGHTALIDLFREYCTIKGCTKGNLAKDDPYEIDFMRLGGGILEVEKFLNCNNVYQNDALFHRLLKQLSSVEFFKEDRKCRDLTSIYLTNLIELEIPNLSQVYYNYAISDKENPNTSIYFLKEMSLKVFRNLTRNYISAVLNIFHEKGKDVLMLNHFFTDLEFDVNRCNDYIPNIKIIALFRDPRDVYFFAKSKNVEWIPHSTVTDFIKWCKIFYKRFNLKSKDYFPLRFEDLVVNYEEVVGELEDFIGLDPLCHNKKQMFLKPQESRKNIGIWESDSSLSSDMEIIYKELPRLCYNKQ